MFLYKRSWIPGIEKINFNGYLNKDLCEPEKQGERGLAQGLKQC